jgi:hypothetical protein
LIPSQGRAWGEEGGAETEPPGEQAKFHSGTFVVPLRLKLKGEP